MCSKCTLDFLLICKSWSGKKVKSRQQVSDNNIWAPGFVRDGFVDDDSLISFFNKLSEANLEDRQLME